MQVRSATFTPSWRLLLVLALATVALAWLLTAVPVHAATGDAATPAAASAPAAESLYPMTAERKTRLSAYTRIKNIWRFSDFFIGLAILGVVLVSGLSSRMRDIATRFRRPFVVTVAFLALYTLVTYLLGLPFHVYRNYFIEDEFGFINQGFLQWWGEDLIGLGVNFLLSILPMWGFYALVRKSRHWWLWLTAAAAPFIVLVIVITPVWISPLTNDYEALRDQALKQEMLALASSAGIEGSDVFQVNASKQSSKVNAYVTGLFDTKRIVLYDTLINNFTVPEIRFVMGHEMGHYVLHHVWFIVAVIIGFVALANWLVHKTIHGAIRRYGESMGVRELGDVASLPLVLAYVSVFSFLFNPVINGASRHWEHQADVFGMQVAGISGETAAVAFEKLSAYNLADPDPHPVMEFWFYNHPSIRKRIAFVRSYRPG